MYSTEILLITATIREVNSTEIDSNFMARETQGVLTIYMGRLEIPVGKSNGSLPSVWEALESMGCDLR